MWLELLTEAVKNSSKAKVAAELGISRTAISLVMHGKYPASTEKIEALVLNHYSRVECPHLCKSIQVTECRQHCANEAPTSSPRAMRFWRACQSCPNKMEGKS